MEKIVKTGNRLRFRQATVEDMDYIMEVEYIPENAKYVIPYTREVHMQTLDTPSATHLIIETLDTHEKVGFLMIAGLDNPSKEIEWTRIILNVKGKGYGQETLEMLKSWAFEHGLTVKTIILALYMYMKKLVLSVKVLFAKQF